MVRIILTPTKSGARKAMEKALREKTFTTSYSKVAYHNVLFTTFIDKFPKIGF